MKMNFKSIVAVILCIVLTVPFSTMASAKLTLPDKPITTNADKVYVSYSSSNSSNGTKATTTGGDGPKNAYLLNQTDGWNMLMGNKTGSATTVNGNKDFSAGGTMVVVGKGAITSASFTFPKTTNPLVITAKDGDTNYISRNEDGTPNTSAQLGMFMTDPNYTITFNGDVIFRDIVFINRQNAASAATKAPTVYTVNGKFVVESSVEFASMGGAMYTLNITESGIAFLDTLGFGKYTGKGTIVIGDEILEAVKAAGKAANFADFEGKIVDKNGAYVFSSEPTLTSDTVIYVAQNKYNSAGLTLTPSTTGGDAPTTPTQTSGDWANTNLYTKAADGAKIVAVGKFYATAGYTFPVTTSPIMITAVHDGVDYTSKYEDGTLNLTNKTDATGGQYGMFMMNKNITLTFLGDVIFDNIAILNRLLTTTTNSTIAVKKSMVISNTVQFASINGAYYNIDVAEGATLYLHADAEGFDAYTGKGTIVIGDEIMATVSEASFEGFEGTIIDEYGRTVNFDEITTAPEESTEAPEESTEAPEDTTVTPEESTDTPEDTTVTPEDTTVTPEESTDTPEESTDTPEESTDTPEDTTVTPEDPDTPVVLPARPTANGTDKIYVSYAGSNSNGSAATATGGSSAGNAFIIKGTSTWDVLMGIATEGNATTYENNTSFAGGGTMIIVGKGAFIGGSFTFPATQNTLVITGKDADTNYISRNEDGTPNTSAQLGMFMTDAGKTITFAGNVIFRDTVILNRQQQATLSAGIHSVSGILMIEDTVEFAATTGYTYTLNVEEGAFAFLDTLGYGKYTGQGTIVLSNEVISAATADIFNGFEGKIVDKNGDDVVFGQPPVDTEEPEDTTAPDDTTATPEDTTAPDDTTATPEDTTAPDDTTATPEDTTAPEDTEEEILVIPTRPTAPENKVYIAYNDNTNLEGAVPSVDGGETAMAPYRTATGTWESLLEKDMAKNGATFVIVGKAYFGSEFTFENTETTYAFTGKDGDANYISYNEDGTYDVDSQYGMFMTPSTITINGNAIFDNTVILNRKTPNSKFVVNGILVINETVDFVNLGTSTYALEVNQGGVVFLDSLGFGSYTGKGTIVIGDALLSTVKKADFSGFEGKVVDKNGCDIFPGSPAKLPAKDNFIYTADNTTDVGDAATENGGATAQAPYKTSTKAWKNLFSDQLANGGYAIVVGKGYFGADCVLPATTKPVVFTALDMDGTTSYISKDENGNLIYMNENGGHLGQYGMFMMAGGATVEFDGDVIFDNIVILNRVAEANNAKIKVNKSLTVTNTVQFANMKDEPCDIHISEGAFLYLNADPAGFEIYSGTGTIVIGDDILDIAHARHFRDFEGRIVDKYGNDFIVGDKAITNDVTGTCDYEYNWLTGVLKITGNGTPGGLVRARYAKEIIFGEGVVSIPANFCYKNTNLTSVTLSSTITSIDKNAFGLTKNLTNFVIPENSSITTIGEKAFLESGITNISFNNIETIGAQAFRDCTSLASVDLGSNVKSIGSYAFAGNSKLESFIFDGTITEIADNTFENAVSLEEITLPDSVTSIGKKAFAYSVALANVELSDSLVSISDSAFKKTALSGTIALPSTVKVLGNNVFEECKGITGITLPNGLEAFGEYCFAYTSITSISIPSGISKISPAAFRGCSALKTVTLDDNITAIQAFAFYESGVESITIPKTCTEIEKSAFRSCTQLKTVTFNSGLKTIRDKAFNNCSSLESISLPETLTTIEQDAFRDCTSLKSIAIPSGVTNIAAATFRNCSSLANVTIGQNVASIGDYAFYNSGVTSIVLPVNCTDIGSSAFRSCKSLSSVTINGAITAIPEKTFRDCSALSTITFSDPSALTSIGAYAFFGCSALESITLPTVLTSLGDNCFSYSGITEIELPASVTAIPAGAFDHCSNLTSVTVAGNITSIGAYAFATSGIVSFVIPQSCTTLGQSIFRNCKDLTSVTIAAPITEIPHKMFSGCTSLTTTNIPESVTEIQSNAYHNCTSLTSITLPNGLVTLSTYAFANTTSLNVAITIPGSCKVIGDSAFMNSAITALTINDGVTTIENCAFYKCTNLTTVTIPESCTVLKDKCFAYSALTEAFVPDSVTSIGTRAFDPGFKATPVELHTEATATNVIEWANANTTYVTLNTDYTPA